MRKTRPMGEDGFGSRRKGKGKRRLPARGLDPLTKTPILLPRRVPSFANRTKK